MSIEDNVEFAALRDVLMEAYDQAASGKGRERHSAPGEPFEDQQICRFGLWLGDASFQVGQAAKKALESARLDDAAAVRELLGAINYLAAAVIVRRRLSACAASGAAPDPGQTCGSGADVPPLANIPEGSVVVAARDLPPTPFRPNVAAGMAGTLVGPAMVRWAGDHGKFWSPVGEGDVLPVRPGETIAEVALRARAAWRRRTTICEGQVTERDR